AKHTAYAHRVGFLGNDVLVEVHVADGGDTGPRQLGDAEPAAPAHGLRLDETALSRPHVTLEPDVQRQVVGEATKQGHRDVGVAVDEPGDHQVARGVDDGGGDVRARDLLAGVPPRRWSRRGWRARRRAGPSARGPS